MVAYGLIYKIESWNTAGHFRNEIEVPGIFRYPKKIMCTEGLFARSLEVPEDHIFRNVTVNAEGNLFLLAGEYSIVPQQDVYELDPSGALVALVELPPRSFNIMPGRNNRLYSVEEDRTIVRQYRLQPFLIQFPPPSRGREQKKRPLYRGRCCTFQHLPDVSAVGVNWVWPSVSACSGASAPSCRGTTQRGTG